MHTYRLTAQTQPYPHRSLEQLAERPGRGSTNQTEASGERRADQEEPRQADQTTCCSNQPSLAPHESAYPSKSRCREYLYRRMILRKTGVFPPLLRLSTCSSDFGLACFQGVCDPPHLHLRRIIRRSHANYAESCGGPRSDTGHRSIKSTQNHAALFNRLRRTERRFSTIVSRFPRRTIRQITQNHAAFCAELSGALRRTERHSTQKYAAETGLSTSLHCASTRPVVILFDPINNLYGIAPSAPQQRTNAMEPRKTKGALLWSGQGRLPAPSRWRGNPSIPPKELKRSAPSARTYCVYNGRALAPLPYPPREERQKPAYLR